MNKHLSFFKHTICAHCRFLFTLSLLYLSSSSFAQLAPVSPPVGGFRIDGDLKAGTPSTGEGDWLSGTSGGYVFYNTGVSVDPERSLLIRDRYHSTGDDVFSGSAFSQNPNSWKWVTASAANKTDINNGMYHIASSGNQKWIIMGGDRESNTGTSYIDFEFYQGYLKKNTNGSFSSLSADSTSLAATNGRTVGDFVLSMEYTNGGALANVHYYRWELSAGSYRYIEYTLPTTLSGSLAFGATNSSSVPTALGAFGADTYQPYLFVEAAANIDAILNAINPCEQISIKTVFIKTKASDSYNAALKDFISPISVNFVFGHETFSYPEGPYYNCGSLTPTFTGSGTFSSSPSGLSINSTTGVVDLAASSPGTYTITYTYDAGGGCTMPTESTLTILPLPAPALVTSQTHCSGSSTSAVNFSSTLTPVSFSWTNSQPSIGLAASGSGNIAAFSTINSGTSPVIATIEYTPYYTTGGSICMGPSRSFTITVNPLPATPQISITEPRICGPATGTIDVTAPAGTGYQYSNNGGGWQSSTSFTGINAGDGYHIRVKDENGCISSGEADCEDAVAPLKAPSSELKKATPEEVKTLIPAYVNNNSQNISIKAFPNPFHSRVSFEVNVKESGYGTLDIYTIGGQKIKTVYAGPLNRGKQYFSTTLPSGSHQLIYTIQIGKEKVSGRLLSE